MATAKIVIHGCIQDIQEPGVPDHRMVSRIIFDVIAGDRKYERCSVELAQPVGSDYESAPIEVGPTIGYNAGWNDDAFAHEMERYYRTQVCGTGSTGVNKPRGGWNTRMRNYTRMITYVFDLELS